MTIATWLTHFILFVTYFGLLVVALILVPMALDKWREYVRQ